MLTPQEVSEKTFIKSMFGGYDMGAVDDFLEQVTQDYTSLYKENAVLKSKLKILVDTLEEYRSVDESMRKTLLSAQKQAGEILEDAQKQRDEMLNDAGATARDRTGELEILMNTQQRRLDAARDEASSFIASMREVCRRQLEALERIENTAFKQAKPSQEETVARDIEETLKNKYSEEAKTPPLPKSAPIPELPEDDYDEVNQLEDIDDEDNQPVDMNDADMEMLRMHMTSDEQRGSHE